MTRRLVKIAAVTALAATAAFGSFDGVSPNMNFVAEASAKGGAKGRGGLSAKFNAAARGKPKRTASTPKVNKPSKAQPPRLTTKKPPKPPKPITPIFNPAANPGGGNNGGGGGGKGGGGGGKGGGGPTVRPGGPTFTPGGF